MDQKYTIFVLRLQDDKYFVGKTKETHQKLKQTVLQTPAAWIEKYPAVEIHSSILGDAYDEDKYVLKCMREYGIENVRGGSYSNVDLSMDQIISIRRALCTATNSCIACGTVGHNIFECKEDICYRCGRTGHSVDVCKATVHVLNGRLDGCYRCGRPDHWSIRCNRSKDIFGRKLDQKCTIV